MANPNPISCERRVDELSVAQPTTADWVQALDLWLRWNDCYEQVTSSAFVGRDTPGKLEELMDFMDQVRSRAIAISRSLLANR